MHLHREERKRISTKKHRGKHIDKMEETHTGFKDE